jgi:hypothetical protein
VRLRRVLSIGAATLAAGGLAAGVAIASAPTAGSPPGPWQVYRSQPFAYIPGEVCAFGVHGDIVKDKERVRTLLTYPDGKPQEQEFTGPLVVRFTNQSTGKSVVRDLSGTGWFFYGRDGATFGHGFEHLSISIHKVNTSPAKGLYYLSGAFDFAINPDGTRNFTVEHGSSENLCDTLA